MSGSDDATRPAPRKPAEAIRTPGDDTASVDHAERLCRLQEALDELDLDGADATIDFEELGARFGVETGEVERVAAALLAVRQALGEDLLGAGPSGPATAADRPPPDLPADYEVISELGAGGMGVVYRVRQRSLDRVIALKVVRPGEHAFESAIRRFRTEAQSLARLRHRHIVTIHEVGESEEGGLYFTMELVEGAPLSELVRRAEVTPTRAVRLVRQIASAIAYAHGKGIIHRDLKPANVLVDLEDDARVVDFGLARDLAMGGDLTETGQVLGTPSYMSPEQARGERDRVGEATDIYALGAILYECLTGRPPFSGMPLLELIRAVADREPPAPRTLDPKVPRDLEVICLKALEKDPQRRYATATAMLEDLARFEEGRPIRARRPSPLYRLIRLVARSRERILAAAIGAVLVAALLVFLRPLQESADSLAAAAEALRGDGEFRGATALYERALDRLDWPPVRDWRTEPGRLDGERERLASIYSGLLASRVDLIARTMDAGRFEEALALAERSFAEGCAAFPDEVATIWGPDGEAEGTFSIYWPHEMQLLWQKAACERQLGRGEAAARSLRMLETDIRRRSAEVREAETAAGNLESAGQVTPAAVFLEMLAPALLDPSDPTHAWAGPRFRELMGHGGLDVAAWWMRQPRPVALLVAALDLQTGAEYPEPYGIHLTRLFEVARANDATWHRDELRAALAAYAADEGRELGDRAGAARVLAVTVDLPFFGDPDPADIRPILDLWSALALLGRREAFSRNVLRAVYDVLLLPEGRERDDVLSGTPLGTWIRQRTGLHDLRRLSDWRSARGAGGPREWLGVALGFRRVPDERDVATVVERYLGDADTDRAAAHFLLTLLLPEDVRVPSWRWAGRGDSLAPPDDLPTEWVAALRDAGHLPDEAPHHLRVALFFERDGEPEAHLAWEEVVPISVAPSKAVELTHRIDPPSRVAPVTLVIDAARPGRLELGVGLADEEPRGFYDVPPRWTVQVRATLAWDGALRTRRLRVRASVDPGGRVDSFAGFADDGTARVGVVATTIDAPIEVLFPDGTVERPILLVVADPGVADRARPWTIEDWRARIAADVDRIAAGFAPLVEDRSDRIARYRDEGVRVADAVRRAVIEDAFPRRHDDLLRATPQVASIVAVPEARSALAAIDAIWGAATRSGEAVRRPMAARLLAGDPGILAESDHLFRDRERSGFWTAHLLARDDPAIRAHALGRLEAFESFPIGVARTLDRAIDEGRIEPPAWMPARITAAEAAHAARAPAAVWTWGPLPAAVLLTLAALALAALAPRARGARRVVLAAVLVGVGLLLSTFRLYHEERLLPLELPGYLAALAGLVVLARLSGRRALAWLPVACLAVAMSLRGLGHLGAPPATFNLAALATWLGVLLLPLAALWLPGADRRGRLGRSLQWGVAVLAGGLWCVPWLEELDRHGVGLFSLRFLVPPGEPPTEQHAASLLVALAIAYAPLLVLAVWNRPRALEEGAPRA